MFDLATSFGLIEFGQQTQWVLAWVCLAIALFVGLFFFWRKANEEHFDLWSAFDAVFISAAVGVVVSRIGYIVFHPAEFGLSVLAWVNVLGYPGLWAPAGIVASVWLLHRWAQSQKLDSWEVWDFFAIFLSWFFAWYWVSRFMLGAAGGRPTELPWGIVFPSRLEAAHPVQLYAALGFFVLFAYLWWAEPRYRFFMWYRSKKRTAKTGFLTAVFTIMWGLLGFGLSFVQYSFFLVWDIDVNQVVSALLFFLGCGLLYVRSGRTFFAK